MRIMSVPQIVLGLMFSADVLVSLVFLDLLCPPLLLLTSIILPARPHHVQTIQLESMSQEDALVPQDYMAPSQPHPRFLTILEYVFLFFQPKPFVILLWQVEEVQLQ